MQRRVPPVPLKPAPGHAPEPARELVPHSPVKRSAVAIPSVSGPAIGSPAFETLREQLAARGNGRAVQTIVFVGCSGREGCGPFVRAFGQNLAVQGSRVLVVDTTSAAADGAQGDGNLANAVSSAAGIPTQVVGQGRLASLTMAVTRAEKEPLLRSPAFGAWLEAQRAVFDYVLFAALPVSQYADAMLLGRVSDGVVLLVQADNTERRDLTRAREQLDRAGVHILGAVLEGVHSELSPVLQRYLGES